jgi:hypothetical protein
MKKELKDFKGRVLPNLNKIKGGGDEVAMIDRDKVRRPKPGNN